MVKENDDFKNREDSLLVELFEFWNYQEFDSNGGKKNIKPVITKKQGCDYRDNAGLMKPFGKFGPSAFRCKDQK